MDKALRTDLEQLEQDIEDIERVLALLRPDGAEFGFWRRCVDQAIGRRHTLLRVAAIG